MATWRVLKRVDRLDDAPPTFASWLELDELTSDSDYYLDNAATRELGERHGAGDYLLVDVGVKSTTYGLRSNVIAVELVGETVYSVREPDDDDDDDEADAELEPEQASEPLTVDELARAAELRVTVAELERRLDGGEPVADELDVARAELEPLDARALTELRAIAGGEGIVR